jgi:hypothetical protein
MDNKAAAKAGIVNSKGISERIPPKSKINKAMFKKMLVPHIKIHRNNNKLVETLFPIINRSNKKLIKSDGAEIMNEPTIKLTNAPGSMGECKTRRK